MSQVLATTARTAVAATHGGRLTVPGRPPVDVGYVDDGGEPLVLVSRCDHAPSGAACLAIDHGPGQRVVLSGVLRPVPDGGDVGQLLGVHRPCFVDALRSGPTRLLRLGVDGVRVERNGAVHSVPWLTYASAEPDLWAAFGPSLAEHLDADHGDVLLGVAQQRSGGAQVIATRVTGLRFGALDLDVVTVEGGARTTVALPTDLTDPHELCGRLVELLATLPGGP